MSRTRGIKDKEIAMGVKSFFTVVVVKVDMWESVIVDERHFGNRKDAENFKNSLSSDLNGMVCEVNV